MARQELRAALIESYKARTVDGVHCGLCGADSRPTAFHVCDFYQSDLSPRLPCVLIGENSIGRRWSLPVCNVCAPPCRACQLPILTGWIRSAVSELQTVAWAAKAKIGLGVCSHHHPLTALKSLNRRPYWTASELAVSMDADHNQERGQAAVKEMPTGNSKRQDERAPAAGISQPDARAALHRQYAGWDVGDHGGLETFTRYADQPSGYRVRFSFIPLSGSRVDVFAAIIPPPDELNCDRSLAIAAIRHIILGIGSQQIQLMDAKASLLGEHGVQVNGWCDFVDFLTKLSEVRQREEFFLLGLLAIEPFSRQLGGQPLTVSTAGLLDQIETSAARRARSR